jgi:hypothetical protein
VSGNELEGKTVLFPCTQFGFVPTGVLKFCCAQPLVKREATLLKPSLIGCAIIFVEKIKAKINKENPFHVGAFF